MKEERSEYGMKLSGHERKRKSRRPNYSSGLHCWLDTPSGSGRITRTNLTNTYNPPTASWLEIITE